MDVGIGLSNEVKNDFLPKRKGFGLPSVRAVICYRTHGQVWQMNVSAVRGCIKESGFIVPPHICSFCGWKLRQLAAVPLCLRHNHPRAEFEASIREPHAQYAASEEHYTRQIYMKHLGTAITALQLIKPKIQEVPPEEREAVHKAPPGLHVAGRRGRQKWLIRSWWLLLSGFILEESPLCFLQNICFF